MKFPPCLSESETIERALKGANLARYGDGEFALAKGGNCVSQRGDTRLAAELRAILESAPKGCLPCLPDPNCGGGKSPKRENWLKVETNSGLVLGKQEYGSAFITRPDTAPWIDTAQYWNRVRDFWRGKDVTLVKGSERSLRLNMMMDARSVREVWGTFSDAYDARGRPPDARDKPGACQTIDELCEAVGTPGHTALLCIGPTGTVMAARLARKGVHAVDVGHLGMFMRHAGAYRFKADDLASSYHRAMIKGMHERGWSGSGHTHAAVVNQLAIELDAESILDYGAGDRSLERKMAETYQRRVDSYDPAYSDKMPKPHDLVVCTDVLEHVEPDKLDNVLGHIRTLAGKGAYISVSLAGSKHDSGWWIKKINNYRWIYADPPLVGDNVVTMWLMV